MTDEKFRDIENEYLKEKEQAKENPLFDIINIVFIIIGAVFLIFICKTSNGMLINGESIIIYVAILTLVFCAYIFLLFEYFDFRYKIITSTAKKYILDKYNIEVREGFDYVEYGKRDIIQLHYKNLIYIHYPNFWCITREDNRLVNGEYKSKNHYYLIVRFIEKDGKLINYRREISKEEYDNIDSDNGYDFRLITESFD